MFIILYNQLTTYMNIRVNHIYEYIVVISLNVFDITIMSELYVIL